MAVRLPQPGESMLDARVGGAPLEIKTVTGNGEVTGGRAWGTCVRGEYETNADYCKASEQRAAEAGLPALQPQLPDLEVSLTP